MKDFFISYTGADEQWAEWIAWQLHHAGYTTVFQKWDFHAGGNFVLEMHRAAKETERTLAVLSPRYLNACFTNPEWAAAFVKDPKGDDRLLVPVRIEEFKPDGLFASLIHINLAGLCESDAKTRLLEKIEATLNGGSAGPKAKVAFPGTPSYPATKAPRYPGSLPDVCNLARRNPNFTGRENILETLRTSLRGGHHTALTQQAIHGLGGIGKSALALEYAWRNSAAYDLIWWLRAEEPSTLASDYAALAAEVGLPESEAKDQSITIQAVKKWLDHNSGWLLIFDNARDAESIKSYLPTGTGGHALITSRNQNWNNNFCASLRIEVWSREESVAFLQKRTGEEDEIAAAKLAETLGNLPLALEQAAAYCHARQKSFAEYLQLFTTRRAELWKREKQPDNYPFTVATTWSLAFQEIAQISFATEILNLCTLVAPDAIPRKLIMRALEHYASQEGEETSVDQFALDDALEALATYSLVTLEKEHLSIHRLVQMVAQESVVPETKELYLESLIKALSEHFPDDGYANPFCWPECGALILHAETLVNSTADETPAWNELSVLLGNMDNYLSGRAEYARAELFVRRALNIREKQLGAEHPDVAVGLINLGNVLREQGNYVDPEALFRRALVILEKQLGPDHPYVATSLNNLAGLLQAQGKNAEAEPLYRRSLAIHEKQLGPEHPYVALSLNNLAELMRKQGKLAEAESLHRRSLAIREKQVGPDHSYVALSLNNLAALLFDQDNFAEAESLYHRAVAILEKSLGPDHPNTITVKNNHNDLLNKMNNI